MRSLFARSVLAAMPIVFLSSSAFGQGAPSSPPSGSGPAVGGGLGDTGAGSTTSPTTSGPSATTPGALPPTPTATPTPTPAPTAAAPPQGDDDEGVMTVKASRNLDMQQFAEASQQELKIAGARARYALNLFGDLQLGMASRSEGDVRRPDPAFAVGVFDALFTANLENGISMTSEVTFQYEPNTSIATLERLQMRWRPSKHFFVDVGRIHTELGYWNVAYHHGRYLQLTTNRPRTIELHGGILPVHWTGAQVGVAGDVGPGTVTVIGTVGAAREKIGSVGHSLHGSALSSINGVHGKLDFGGYLHRDLHFGVAAVYDRIPDEATFVRPGLPDQSIDEKVGNVYVALPSIPVVFISEAYVVEHSLTSDARPENAGSKWRTYGAFAMFGYRIGKVTPYIRGEYVASQVGAFIFNPFYFPEPKSSAGFPVALDLKEGVLGTRIDVSDWSSLKLEYHVTGGVGTRRPELPTPIIHTGIASWSFGI